MWPEAPIQTASMSHLTSGGSRWPRGPAETSATNMTAVPNPKAVIQMAGTTNFYPAARREDSSRGIRIPRGYAAPSALDALPTSRGATHRMAP